MIDPKVDPDLEKEIDALMIARGWAREVTTAFLAVPEEDEKIQGVVETGELEEGQVAQVATQVTLPRLPPDLSQLERAGFVAEYERKREVIRVEIVRAELEAAQKPDKARGQRDQTRHAAEVVPIAQALFDAAIASGKKISKTKAARVAIERAGLIAERDVAVYTIRQKIT